MRNAGSALGGVNKLRPQEISVPWVNLARVIELSSVNKPGQFQYNRACVCVGVCQTKIRKREETEHRLDSRMRRFKNVVPVSVRMAKAQRQPVIESTVCLAPRIRFKRRELEPRPSLYGASGRVLQVRAHACRARDRRRHAQACTDKRTCSHSAGCTYS